MFPCTKFLKHIIGLLNILFVLASLSLLGYGIYLQVTAKAYEVFSPANVFIISGIVLCIVAVLGCVGAYSENHHVIFIYATVLPLLALGCMACGILYFAQKVD